MKQIIKEKDFLAEVVSLMEHILSDDEARLWSLTGSLRPHTQRYKNRLLQIIETHGQWL